MTVLLQKKGFLWSDSAQKAFDQLKQAMSATPVLALPDFTKSFCVETDACATGIGAVLMQEGHPVAFYSKALSVNNQKLSIYEKEFLAIMMAVDRWRPYLSRGSFTIKTDHKSLCHLQDQVLTSDLQRKAMTKLVGLHFTFQYKKGQDNKVADALSSVGHVFSLHAVSAGTPLWIQEILNSYAVDPKAQELLVQLAVSGTNDDGFQLQQGLIRLHGKVWVGANVGLQTKLISAFHASAVGGHSGIHATYQRLNKLFAWSGLKGAVEDFVKQCAVCQQAKHEHCKTPGLLQPLPLPQAAWHDISMDFIDGLPKSAGYDVILVVVDRFTKYAHFLPLKHPYTAASVAKAVFQTVVRLHGMPASIVSNRDKVFTSNFWKELFSLLDTKLQMQMSSTYHPQSDGQTERVNQSLEMYLRCATHAQPTKWFHWLPLAEFWYNTSHHMSLGCSPFKALYHQEPHYGMLPDLQQVSNVDVHDFLKARQHCSDLLRYYLERAQLRMKHYANLNRSHRELQVGESVYLKLQPYAQT